MTGRCRPDIAFGVASLSQVVENPAMIHWKRLIQVLKYLNSTQSLGLFMPYSKTRLQVTSYADASWASDPNDRRSWSGYTIFINKIPILWRVLKQTSIAISPMEAEFIAVT